MKTIFITGASTGLGRSAAKLFQSKGWHVIATMRNPEKETELLDLKNITILKLNISDNSEIEKVVKETLERFSVDVVLNNAGYGLVGVLEALADEQIIKQLNTNLIGTIRVTKGFLPFFREKRSGMFINITSMFGLIGYPTCTIYAASKFAIDGFSESLAYELAHLNIKVKIIAPGGIQTDFAGRSMDGATHDSYYEIVKLVSSGYSEESIKLFSSPDLIASVIFDAATDNKNQLRYIAGNDAFNFYNEREKLGAEKQVQNLVQQFTF